MSALFYRFLALGDGGRLAGQRRLVDLETNALDDANVGGYLISDLEDDDVAGYEIDSLYLRLLFVAHDGAGR